MSQTRNAYTTLVGKPKWKRKIVRPRLRWEDNILLNLKAIGFQDVN